MLFQTMEWLAYKYLNFLKRIQLHMLHDRLFTRCESQVTCNFIWILEFHIKLFKLPKKGVSYDSLVGIIQMVYFGFRDTNHSLTAKLNFMSFFYISLEVFLGHMLELCSANPFNQTCQLHIAIKIFCTLCEV